MAVVCSKIAQRRILNSEDLFYRAKIEIPEYTLSITKATQASCAFTASTTVSELYINS